MEAAARIFAGELGMATRTVRHAGVDCLLTPSGARVHLLYLVGALTATSGDARSALVARIADPTGVFLIRATPREPDLLAVLAGITPPSFVAVLGYAETGRQGTVVRPVSIATVDRAARDRWLVRTADLSAARLEEVAAHLRGEQVADPLVDEAIQAYGIDARSFERLRELALQALAPVPDAQAADPGLRNLLLERIDAGGRDGVEQSELISLGAARGCRRVEVEDALARLLGEGECYMPRRGLIRRA
ncbi:MAG: hypothetical protein GXY82_10405 [Methanospirillum sp.]|nr:hypothetical protein [Methanospirillum sp.]